MKKLKACPFCGAVPSGKKFCSTDHGPALMCDTCGSQGPAALDRTWAEYVQSLLFRLATNR